jgi:hypothetical protein
MVASVDNTITDVLTSIKENFGASGGDDVDNEDDPLSSSEVSVTPSQSVDGTEPVTQLCDVPAQLIAEQENVAGKKLRAYERRKVKDSSRAPVLGGVVAAQKELRSKSVHDTHAPDPNSDVAPANELRSKRVHDPVDDVGDMSDESTTKKEIRSKTVHDPVDDMSDESTPEKEIRSKTVHDPVDHISLLVRAKEQRSKAIHDDVVTNVDVDDSSILIADVSVPALASVTGSPVAPKKPRDGVAKKK